MKTPVEIIQSALKDGRKALFEHEAKELVRALGVTVPKSAVAEPQDQKTVLSAAEALGYPLALKAVSPEILHKTGAGAVMLNITGSAALAAALMQMKNAVSERVPGARIRYFLLEKMMPPGMEVLIGGMRDEQFGPAAAFGLGGVWVEALKDASFGILPMTHREMLDMISETRAGMFLSGFRGSPPLDQEAVISILNAVSTLMTDFQEIQEVDLNPVRVYAKGAAALDVRVILRDK